MQQRAPVGALNRARCLDWRTLRPLIGSTRPCDAVESRTRPANIDPPGADARASMGSIFRRRHPHASSQFTLHRPNARIRFMTQQVGHP